VATFKSPDLVPKGSNTGPFIFGAGRETTISLANYAQEIRDFIESKHRASSWAARCAISVLEVYFEDQDDWKALKWEWGRGYGLPGPEGYYWLGSGYFPGDLSQTTGD
jgi:hypothetical protein